MREIKYGSPGMHFPPAENIGAMARYFEEQNYDFITWADQLSLTIPRSIWTPDLVPAAEIWDIDVYMDPWVMMTIAALATEKIEIGSVAMDTLRRTPANLAQLMCSLSHVSKGRFWVTLAAGENKQFVPYGLPREKPFLHLEEAIKIIGMFMKNEGPISYDGPLWKLDDAIMALKPYENELVPMLVAGGPGRALRIAAEQGDGWTVYLPACGDADWYGEQVENMRRGAEKAGRDPDKLKFCGVFMCIIDEDEKRLDEICHNAALRWDAAACVPGPPAWERFGYKNPLGDWAYSRDLIPMKWPREDALKIIDQVPVEMVRNTKMTGSPKQVAEMIQPYINAGCNYVFVADYAGVVTSGDWGDAKGKPNYVAQTFEASRKLNGISV